MDVDSSDLLRRAAGTRPLLISAAERGLLREAKIALARGEHVDSAGPRHFTALHLAAGRGDLRMAELLIQAGASLELRSKPSGETALAIAAAKGRGDVVAALLSAGANPDPKAGEGSTPIMRAASSGHVNIVKSLAAAGADLSSQDDRGSPLHHAVLFHQLSCVHVLLSLGAPIELPNAGGATPLHAAAGHGSVGAAKALLGAGADPDAVNKIDGRTALMATARGDDGGPTLELLFELLRAAGADILATDAQGLDAEAHATIAANQRAAQWLARHKLAALEAIEISEASALDPSSKPGSKPRL